MQEDQDPNPQNMDFEQSQERETDQQEMDSNLNISEFMNDYFKKTRGKKNQDAYFNDLNNLVDKALSLIATKIAEKKSLEIENTSAKININKLREEQVSIQKKIVAINKQLTTAVSENDKLVNSNKEIENTIQVFVNKKQVKEQQYNEEIQTIKENYEDLHEKVETMHNEFQEFMQLAAEEKKQIRIQIKELEQAHIQANKTIEDLKKKSEISEDMEKQRVKMLRNKSKLLSNLIHKEEVAGFNSQISQNLAKILSSPKKVLLDHVSPKKNSSFKEKSQVVEE